MRVELVNMRAGPVGLWREHVCVDRSDLCRTGRVGTVFLWFSKACKKILSGWERMTHRGKCHLFCNKFGSANTYCLMETDTKMSR